jgi:hypothetical protein
MDLMGFYPNGESTQRVGWLEEFFIVFDGIFFDGV